jgi:uncharacterized membrane protein
MSNLERYGSLIAPHDTWTLVSLVVLGVAVSIYLEQTYRWAAKLSGPVLALVGAMILSNLKIMPSAAPVYDLVDQYLIPVAIPLLLFRANLFRIVRTTGTMFVAFHVSVLGTVVGAVLAALLFQSAFDSVPEVAGIMTGSYSGGAVNFFAVKDDFNVSEDLTNPLLVADNFIMAGMFMLLLGIAGSTFFRRHYRHAEGLEKEAEEDRPLAAGYWRRKEISLLDLAKSLAIAVTIAAAACKLSAVIGGDSAEPASFARSFLGNRFVLITLISVTAATLFDRRLDRINGSEELGAYMLYVFFFLIGLPADLMAVLRNMPVMFVFCLVMALVNLAVTLSLGKLMRLNLEELLICVNATLGGAPSAAAMAIAKGWPKLVLPALLVGIWGYVIGTPLGIAVGRMLAAVF